MGSLITLDPKQCLLSLLSDPDTDKFLDIFTHETRFMARKTRAWNLMQVIPNSLQAWMRNINATLPYKK